MTGQESPYPAALVAVAVSLMQSTSGFYIFHCFTCCSFQVDVSVELVMQAPVHTVSDDFMPVLAVLRLLLAEMLQRHSETLLHPCSSST